MSQFHNPYHFVPVAPKPNAGLALADFPGRLPTHLSLACHAPGTLSGRLIARLETASPLVIGSEQVSGKGKLLPGVVSPFKIGGKAAVPGSSLRGLVSATAEAASNSALRVLSEKAWDRWEDGHYKKGARSKSSPVKEFEKICPDFVPLGKSHKRKNLTLAEEMFGFVEHREPDRKYRDPAMAMASRLRFHHGLATSEIKLDRVMILRELSDPKPPRASFYYEPSAAAKIPAAGARPKGRKFYLPAPEGMNLAVDPESQRRRETHKERKTSERQLSVTPVPAGSVFWFAVDFTSLRPDELDLLCYAIQPRAWYLHRLGLGKPLGLGLVRIEAVSLFLLDPVERYGGVENDTLFPERYPQRWVSEDPDYGGWKSDARFVMEAASVTTVVGTRSPADRVDCFRRAATSSGLADCIEALEMLGNRSLVRHPVHYPALAGPDLEDNLYEWFRDSSEYLPSLPNAGTLPTLSRSGGSSGGSGALAKPPAGPGKSGASAVAKPPKVGEVVLAKVEDYLKSKTGAFFAVRLDVSGHPGFLHAAKLGQGYVDDIRNKLTKGKTIRVRLTALQDPKGKPILQCTMKGVPQS